MVAPRTPSAPPLPLDQQSACAAQETRPANLHRDRPPAEEAATNMQLAVSFAADPSMSMYDTEFWRECIEEFRVTMRSRDSSLAQPATQPASRADQPAAGRRQDSGLADDAGAPPPAREDPTREAANRIVLTDQAFRVPHQGNLGGSAAARSGSTIGAQDRGRATSSHDLGSQDMSFSEDLTIPI